jgi:hypothetical protein
VIIALLTGLAAVAGWAQEKEPAGKVAIVLLAGNETNEGMARAVHALLYARELADSGFKVALIFDGAGTGWAEEMNKPENPLHRHYQEFKQRGIVEEICDYCSERLGHRENISEEQRKLVVGDYEGHPNIAKWVSMGYQIIVI